MRVYENADINHNTQSDVTVEPRKLYTTINTAASTATTSHWNTSFLGSIYTTKINLFYSIDKGNASDGWVVGWWGTSSPINRMEEWNKVAACE